MNYLKNQNYTGTLNAGELVMPNSTGNGRERCSSGVNPSGICVNTYNGSLCEIAPVGTYSPTTRTDANGTDIYQGAAGYDLATSGSVKIGKIMSAPGVSDPAGKYIFFLEDSGSGGTPLPISNTGGFMSNREDLSNGGGMGTIHSSSFYLASGPRYFVIIGAVRTTASNQFTDRYIHELDTGTNTWINRGYGEVGAAATPIIDYKVYRLAGDTGLRFVTRDSFFAPYQYNDYTFSTDAWSTGGPQVPDPGVGLTLIADGSYDSIGGYSYKPYRSNGTYFGSGSPVNYTASIFTVSTI